MCLQFGQSYIKNRLHNATLGAFWVLLLIADFPDVVKAEFGHVFKSYTVV
jgi:hypothetical protein